METTLKDFVIAPSQGTHFFQNLTSLRIGYFTVNPLADEGFIDWKWLDGQPAVEENEFLRHVLVDEPLDAVLDGRNRRGFILKPDGIGRVAE